MGYDLESELLRAARELTTRRDELHRRIGAAVGGEPYEHWLDNRQRGLDGVEHDGEWSWVTLEPGLDVFHADGRRAWLEYGHCSSLGLFTAAALDCFIHHARVPWLTFPRLAHPLLSQLIVPLAETLVGNGCFVRVGVGYSLTEMGLAHVLQGEPQMLDDDPDGASRAFEVGEPYPIPLSRITAGSPAINAEATRTRQPAAAPPRAPSRGEFRSAPTTKM
jgi:hypothetical protein